MIVSMKFKVWSSLVVPGNGLGEDTVLETRNFSSMKTQDLRSGDDNVCALFPSGRCCFWRIMFVVRVFSSVALRVLLLRVVHHHNEVFVFFFSISYIFS
jgi:hypothetical protein